jgi:rSAM/selenodomain-associated transferase 2
MSMSIIIPVLNDAPSLGRLLDDLSPARTAPITPEIIVVDGGSADDPQSVCAARGVSCISGARGRGLQLATGIAASRGEVIWMLHADTRLDGAEVNKVAAVETGWGRCLLAFDPPFRGMAMVALFMHWRSLLTGICTGDQGIFTTRQCLLAAGGMPAQPLMEDIELSRRLKSTGRPRVLPVHLRTSPRRWQKSGLWRTILFMWRIRLRYWFGASPEVLLTAYSRGPEKRRE